MMRRILWSLTAIVGVLVLGADVATWQGRGGRGGGGGGQNATAYLIKPARVFDGDAMHDEWVVVVRGSRIEAARPAAS